MDPVLGAVPDRSFFELKTKNPFNMKQCERVFGIG